MIKINTFCSITTCLWTCYHCLRFLVNVALYSRHNLKDYNSKQGLTRVVRRARVVQGSAERYSADALSRRSGTLLWQRGAARDLLSDFHPSPHRTTADTSDSGGRSPSSKVVSPRRHPAQRAGENGCCGLLASASDPGHEGQGRI